MAGQDPKPPAGKTVFDALLKAGVIKSDADLTPDMLQLIKETNEAAAILGENANESKNDDQIQPQGESKEGKPSDLGPKSHD